MIHDQLRVWALSLLLLTACSGGDEFEELRRYVESVKKRPPRPIEKIPEYDPYPLFQYSADGLRSPFVAKVIRKRSGIRGPDMSRPREALEAFPLDAMRMVGILSQNKKVWGLVEDPRGIVHRVQVGSYLGKNFGRVTKISRERIDILESVRDRLGEWKNRENHLALKKNKTES